MYPICYQWVSGRYFQPEPAMYSRCFCWFPGPLAPSASAFDGLTQIFCQKESVKFLDVADMCKTISLAWEQRKGGKTPCNQAQKLSAVKRGLNEPPFKQQQGDGQ